MDRGLVPAIPQTHVTSGKAKDMVDDLKDKAGGAIDAVKDKLHKD